MLKQHIRFTNRVPGWIDQVVAVYQKKIASLEFSTVESPYGFASASLIEEGKAEVSTMQANVAYTAFTQGTDRLRQPHTKLRGMAVLYPMTLHVLARPGSHFRDMRDLIGKRLGVGPAGATAEMDVDLLLSQLGMNPSQIHFERMTIEERTERLATGDLDATAVFLPDPSSTIQSALAVSGTYLLPIRGAAISKLSEEHSFLRPAVIPASAYGQSEDIETVGVDLVMVCREDLPEETVYEMLKVFFDSLRELAQAQPALQRMDLAKAPGTPIPLHPGAARYYREVQLFN